MIEIRSFRDLLRLFFIFRRELVWAVIATALVAVLGAFLLPAKYESNARLLAELGLESTMFPIELANRHTLIAPSTQRDSNVDKEHMLTARPIREPSRHEPASFQAAVVPGLLFFSAAQVRVASAFVRASRSTMVISVAAPSVAMAASAVSVEPEAGSEAYNWGGSTLLESDVRRRTS